MLLLVEIDLSAAELGVFEEYENRVLALLPKYGATLEARVRSLDDRSEVHLLRFPDDEALEASRNDPDRLAAQDLWTRCGASLASREVKRIADQSPRASAASISRA